MLPSPFFVIATQNNVELSGTYPLPEAQLDRFAARITIGYPSREDEKHIMESQSHTRPVDSIEPVISPAEVIDIQSAARDVHVNSSLRDYILDIVSSTRTHPSVSLGASPRGSLYLLYASQALAAIQGRDYVIPDDIKAMALPVLAHRMILRPEHRTRGTTSQSCLTEILQRIPVPVSAKVHGAAALQAV
jgi:MoxR-like ATPase